MTQTLALIAIAIFVVILILVGYYYRTRRTAEDFFIAKRKASVRQVVSSTFTVIGAGEIVTLTAFAYIYGLSGVSLFVGLSLGLLTVAILSKRIRHKSSEYKPYTITDYIRKFVGSKSEKISIVLSLITFGSILVIQLVVGGLLISALLSWPYISSVLLIGFVIAVYLTLGGFNSVLTTDVFQAVSMIVLIVALVIFYNPSGSSLTQLIASTQHIIPPVDFIVLIALGFFAIVGAADVYQRIYSASSDKEAKKGMLGAGFLILVFGVLVMILGLRIFTQFPLADPNDAFTIFLTSSLSPLIIAILSVFIISSLFSTADTELFLTSILVGKLVLGKKKLESSMSKLLIWIIMLLGVLVAIYFNSLVEIYLILLYAVMIIGPVILARLFGRGKDNIAFFGMLVSLILLIMLSAFNLLVGLYPLLLIIPPALSFLVPASQD